MIHTYKISGMTCGGCKAQVQDALSSVEGIKRVEVDLHNEIATVEMGAHVSTEQLQNALKRYPRFGLSELKTPIKKVDSETDFEIDRPWFEKYRPIILLFSFIVLVTVAAEIGRGEWLFMRWMNNFMAGFFISFSFFKMLDLKGFAENYASYDVIAKKWLGWGYVYAFTELALGVAFLTGFSPLATNLVTFLVMGISIVGVLQSVLVKRKIKCACLGAVFNLPMSTVTVIEDALMIMMSGYMIASLIL